MYKKHRVAALVLSVLLLLLSACGAPQEEKKSSESEHTQPSSSQSAISDPEISDSPTDPALPDASSGTDLPTEGTDSGTASSEDLPAGEDSPEAPDQPTTDSGSQTSEPDWKPAEKPETEQPAQTTPLNPDESTPYGRAWIQTQPNAALLLQAYDALEQGTREFRATITFPKPIPVSQLKTLWYCYYDDHPEHFWVDTGFSYSYRGSDALSVSPTYTMSPEEKATAEAKLNRAVSDLLEGLSGSMTPYDLEKEIHDRLVLSCSYQDGPYAHTSYGALVQKSAVCDGYARAFQLLCKEVGIQALLVRGTSINPASQQSEGHAWNIVRISGQYYHVDITWDDAGDPASEREIHYAWFNLSTAQIRQDHTVGNDGYPLPTCTSTEHNYYEKTGRILTTLTVDGLLKLTYYDDGAYHCNVYVKNPGTPEQWFDANLDTLASRMGLNGYSFSVIFAGNEIYYTIIPK